MKAAIFFLTKITLPANNPRDLLKSQQDKTFRSHQQQAGGFFHLIVDSHKSLRACINVILLLYFEAEYIL